MINIFYYFLVNINLLQGSGTEIKKEVLSNANFLTVRFHLTNLYYGIKNYEGKDYLYFDSKNIGISEKIGDPELPVLRKLIEVPEGANVSYKILNLKEKTFSLREMGLPPLKPRLPPVPKIKGEKEEFVINEETYSLDKFIPEKNVEIKEIGKLREHRLFHLIFYPVRYNPLRNEIKVISEIEILVEFDGTLRKEENKRKDNDVIKGILKEHILNYEHGLYGTFPPLPIGILVIYPDEWENYILPLLKWKKKKGYYVKLAPLSVTGYDTLSIRNYIINLYNTWDKNLTFVILIGDVDKIPHFTSTEINNPANDLKYGLIDNNDYIPDLYVGRISVNDPNQLTNVVNKILNYEKVIWQEFDWAKKAFFIASADPSFHDVAEGTHLYSMQIVRNHGMIADSLFAYYQSGAPTIIRNALNNGRSLCTYSGHGTDNGWSDYGDLEFYNSDVYNLFNSYKLPFVQSYACLTGAYATNVECFMEAWLRAPSKGAVASFGSSVYSYWDEDDILQRRIFDETFDSGYVWLSGLITEGKIELLNYYGNTPTVHRYFQMYNLFGDPSLILFTNIPLDLTVNHPATVPMGNVNIDVNVSDINGAVENALVCVMQNDSILDAKYTDLTGSATLNLNITSPDTVFITVTSYNHKPYYGFMLVVTSGPYVIKGYSIIDDISGNNNGIINPGEIINYSVFAKNVGSDPAYGVYGILTSSHVNIIKDSSWYGDILPGDSVLGFQNYRFQVPQNVENNQNLSFSLTFYDSNNNTWISNFFLKVYKPLISKIGEYITNDGNGNGILEPDEQGNLIVIIKNIGGDSSSQVVAKLKSLSPYLIVVDSLSNYGAIKPGDTLNNLYDPFIIYADPATPMGYQAQLLFITQTEYDVDTFNIGITVGKKHYFVWDPDSNHSSGPVIHSLLQQLGYKGDYSTSLSNFSKDLYIALFVCVGIYPNNYIIPLNSQEALTIVDFAQNSGGRVYLEGGDVWYWDPLYEDGHDFGPLFGILPLDDGSSDLAPIQGQQGTFTRGMYFSSYSGENAWIDHIEAQGAGAFNIFYDTDNGYYCGVARDAGTYKTVGMSFELAGLDDGNAPSTRLALLDSIMHFFGIYTVSVKEKNIPLIIPKLTKLIGVIPNPVLDNSAQIVFDLSKKEKVNLFIYDIAGRNIQKLIKGEILNPGTYKIIWDTQKIPQGIYFIKLETGNYKGVKKGIILK